MARKSKSSSRPPSQRQLRVGEQLRHLLSLIFLRQDRYIEELNGLSITVTQVSVSPDLSNARVFIMPLGGMNISVVLPLLNKLAPVFSHQVAQQVHLRRVPKLKFVLDNSYDQVDRIMYLFNNLPPAPESEQEADGTLDTQEEPAASPDHLPPLSK